jgi:hypothetical protein
MNELEALKKLVAVLTNQRNFALDSLAQMEVRLIMERETKAATSGNGLSASTPPEVGYGKPPLHTRFQKGKSGNPKGRPAASADEKRDGPALVASINAAIRNGSRLRTS